MILADDLTGAARTVIVAPAGPGIGVPDAASNAALARIARAGLAARPRPLFVGSAPRGIDAIRLLGEAEPGVPFGIARDRTLICTKAGAFGRQAALVNCVARLKREMT